MISDNGLNHLTLDLQDLHYVEMLGHDGSFGNMLAFASLKLINCSTTSP
jgi:hypothetical protein